MIDGRLLVPAGALWLGAFVSVGRIDQAPDLKAAAGWAGSLGVASAVTLVVIGAFWAAMSLTDRRRGPFGCTCRTRLMPLLLAAVFTALGVGVSTLWLQLGLAEPIAGWVDQRVTAVAVGTIQGEARLRSLGAASGFGPTSWQEVTLSARSLHARGATITGSWSLVVRMPVGVRAPPPGSVVRLTGRLGRAPLRTGRLARLSVGAGDPLVLAEPGPISTAAQAMRDGLRRALQHRDAAAAALVAGLAIGDEQRQSDALRSDMRASGLAHLTAVSGGNVAIVVGAVLLLARGARLRLIWRVGVALGALAYFVVLVGPEPSVLRAAAMGAIAVGAILAGGRRAGPSILATGVLVLLLVQPWLAVSWGFGLSVAATAGLILLAPRVRRWLAQRRWAGIAGAGVRDAVALTVSAQLATLPILVAMGGAAGWVSVPANLAAMPVVPPITILGLAAGGLSPVLPGVASVLAWLASWPAAWIAHVATVAPTLPLASFPWPEGGWGLALLCAAGIAGVLVRRAGRRLPATWRRLLGTAMAAVLVMSILQPVGRRNWPPPTWFVLMCDVGQGDLLAVRAGPDSALVVDAGPEPDLADSCLADAGIESIPLLVLTHFHADHAGGLAGVLRRRSIGRAVVAPVAEPPDAAGSAMALLADARVPVDVGWAGSAWTVGGVHARAIAPRRVIESGSRINNASVVLDITVSGRHVLLTGDVETEAQVAIAADLGGRHFDVVKVPHHGSARQAADLSRWAPASVALISVGADNDYGQPAPDTIAAWRAAGALVVRTDEAGTVAVVESEEGAGEPGLGIVRH